MPEPTNPAHCEIGKPSGGKAKDLAREGIVVIPPDGYAVDATGKLLSPIAATAAPNPQPPTLPPSAKAP